MRKNFSFGKKVNSFIDTLPPKPKIPVKGLILNNKKPLEDLLGHINEKSRNEKPAQQVYPGSARNTADQKKADHIQKWFTPQRTNKSMSYAE